MSEKNIGKVLQVIGPVQDIQFEDADFNEDDIFNPKKSQEAPEP